MSVIPVVKGVPYVVMAGLRAIARFVVTGLMWMGAPALPMIGQLSPGADPIQQAQRTTEPGCPGRPLSPAEEKIWLSLISSLR